MQHQIYKLHECYLYLYLYVYGLYHIDYDIDQKGLEGPFLCCNAAWEAMWSWLATFLVSAETAGTGR